MTPPAGPIRRRPGRRIGHGPGGGREPQLVTPGAGRRPPAGDGHRHPPAGQEPLTGPGPVPAHVADAQRQVGRVGPPGPARHHHQDGPALPGPGHQPAGHGRAGGERGAEHHQVHAVDHRRGDLGPGHSGAGDHGQPGQVDAEFVGGDRPQAVQSDQGAPRPGPRGCGQERQCHADAAVGGPSRIAAPARPADHDGGPPTQAAVGEQGIEGWGHREEAGLARRDRSCALGQQGQGGQVAGPVEPPGRGRPLRGPGIRAGRWGGATNICSIVPTPGPVCPLRPGRVPTTRSPTDGRPVTSAAPDVTRNSQTMRLTASLPALPCAHQREEVVQLSSQRFGTLEVAGR